MISVVYSLTQTLYFLRSKDICHGISPGRTWLTFLHQQAQSQGLWPWLHGCHCFPLDMVSACAPMTVCPVLMSEHGDIKHVIMNVNKVLWAVAQVIYHTFPLV